jgi:hypothetical protein
LTTNKAGNGSQQPSPEEEDSSAAPPITTELSGQLSIRKSTGPRTPEGKEVSKHNALRHGIFSEVTVLPGESSDEYESLLKGLSEALQPESGLEKLLVEKLAMLAWRHRRLLQVEGAEIQQASEFVEWDRRMQQSHEAEIAKRTLVRHLKTFNDRPGLIPEMQNPEILEYCVVLLLELQQSIKSYGFNEHQDRSTLEIIYGADVNLHATLRNSYFIWLNTSRVSEEERQRKRYATPERCKDRMLSEIDVELGRLRDYRKELARIESERTKLEVLRRKVPESANLDRLLRYEASLERAFDRTLNQLERMQRLRRGQPVAPRIDVNVST